MVSLQRIFGCLKSLALLAMLLSVSKLAFALEDVEFINSGLTLCRSGQKACCVNGEMTCVDESTKLCLTSCPEIFVTTDPCTNGQVQYKPSGSCGTTSRTCCSNGTWSDWGENVLTGVDL